MARVKGSFQLGSNYEVGLRRPLDSRQLVTKIADLTNEATWTKYDNGDGTYYNNAYNGMIVAVTENASIYVLKDRSNITSLESGWVKVGENSGAAGSAKSVSLLADQYALPNIGEDNILYVLTNLNKVMYWSSSELRYKYLTGDWQDIEKINGGSAKYQKTKYNYDYTPG